MQAGIISRGTTDHGRVSFPLQDLQIQQEKDRYDTEVKSYTRERNLASAKRTNSNSSAFRWLGRASAGLFGGVAIIATGGLALPIVAGGAIAVEAAMQSDRDKDKARRRAAQT
jgi:hypothetical protein